MKLPFEDLLARYYEEILPGMNRRRRSGKSDSPLKLMEKVCSVEGKPGELIELLGVLKNTQMQLTPELLGEVADVIYYTARGMFHPFFRNLLYLVIPKINIIEGLRACDAKYSARLKYGDHPNIKEAEMGALGLFIDGIRERGYELFLGREVRRSEQVNLYKCWLGSQPLGPVMVKLDQLRSFFPF